MASNLTLVPKVSWCFPLALIVGRRYSLDRILPHVLKDDEPCAVLQPEFSCPRIARGLGQLVMGGRHERSPQEALRLAVELLAADRQLQRYVATRSPNSLCTRLPDVRVPTDLASQVVVDFPMAWDGGGLSDPGIDVDTVSAALPQQVAPVRLKVTDEVEAASRTEPERFPDDIDATKLLL